MPKRDWHQNVTASSRTNHTRALRGLAKGQLSSRFRRCQKSKPSTHRFQSKLPPHTVKFDHFIKSRLFSHNQFQGLMCCKFGHVTPRNLGSTKPSYSTVWSYPLQQSGVKNTVNGQLLYRMVTWLEIEFCITQLRLKGLLGPVARVNKRKKNNRAPD